jgi:hypothetical protein
LFFSSVVYNEKSGKHLLVAISVLSAHTFPMKRFEYLSGFLYHQGDVLIKKRFCTFYLSIGTLKFRPDTSKRRREKKNLRGSSGT